MRARIAQISTPRTPMALIALAACALTTAPALLVLSKLERSND
jgi:hypothetical protein